jgi:hypothetical protein
MERPWLATTTAWPFWTVRQKRDERYVFLYALDPLELNGNDLRREPPVEVRKAMPASSCAALESDIMGVVVEAKAHKKAA